MTGVNNGAWQGDAGWSGVEVGFWLKILTLLAKRPFYTDRRWSGNCLEGVGSLNKAGDIKL